MFNLSLIAMEPPISFTAKHFRDKQVELLDSVRSIKPADAVRAQYGAGKVEGKKVKAYRQEAGVAPRSRAETFVAMKVHIDNWRWSGVAFYLRTGKSLSKALPEIAVPFSPSTEATTAKRRAEQASRQQLCLHAAAEAEAEHTLVHWHQGAGLGDASQTCRHGLSLSHGTLW